jgi:hypothetical protein
VKLNIKKLKNQIQKQKYQEQKANRIFEQRLQRLQLVVEVSVRPSIDFFKFCDDGKKHEFKNIPSYGMKYDKTCSRCGYVASTWAARSDEGHRNQKGCQFKVRC